MAHTCPGPLRGWGQSVQWSCVEMLPGMARVTLASTLVALVASRPGNDA